MCTPASAALMGLDAAGSIYAANAEREAGRAKQNYYNFLADQNERQAKLTLQRGEETATGISATSAIDESNLKREASKVAGSQVAAIGANGVSSDSVTAEDISRDTSRTESRDVTALRYDADSKIWATKTAASDNANALRDQATSLRMAGGMARKAGDVAATSSLIGGATSVADTYYRFGQTGAGKSVKTRSSRPSGGYAAAPDYGNA